MTVTNVTEDRMNLQFSFLSPFIISNDGFQHSLSLNILNSTFFQGNLMSPNSTFKRRFPRQYTSKIDKEMT